jgi:hypothetical protein
MKHTAREATDRVSLLPAFRALVMLQQLFVAGNHIAMLTTFDALASLPALVEISVARNPVAALANCEEHLIRCLRQLQSIDGKVISQPHRQSATMHAAKQRLEMLEQQVRATLHICLLPYIHTTQSMCITSQSSDG